VPDINAWLGNTMPLAEWLDDWDRAVDTARIISDKPTTITVQPVDGRTVAAQTVRIEALTELAVRQAASGTETGSLRVMVLGYKGHPTLADADLVRGDRFSVDGTLFEVILIQPGHSDRLIAIAEARK
jgi:hypothetical protein